MKLYEIQWHKFDGELRRHWTHSKVQAKRYIGYSGAKDGWIEGASLLPIEVPMTREELAAWLNRKFDARD